MGECITLTVTRKSLIGMGGLSPIILAYDLAACDLARDFRVKSRFEVNPE
jgi:hypothetical protein